MSALVRAAGPLGLVVLLGGCAYYNAMYNANRLAGQAEESQRAGRTAEARERWRQASVHAESLLSRHPRSRWADDARALRGRALVQLELYGDAVDVLQQVVAEAPDDRSRAVAQLYLGRAYVALRMYADALAAYDDVMRITDPALRSQAALLRGQVRLVVGDAAGAMQDLLASGEPEARIERVRAALALGQPERAAAFADSAAQVQPFREATWLPLLDTLGRAVGAERTSALTERFAARRDIGRGVRARLFLADGDRLQASGRAQPAADRYEFVLHDVPDSTEGRVAEVRLARLALRGPITEAERARLHQRLQVAVAGGGEPGRLAQELVGVLDRADMLIALDSGDGAFAYLGAEMLRDSIPAPALAAAAFAQMAGRWPASPWTPKALLAAVHAGHPAADSLLAVLAGQYAASPYTVAARGSPDAAADTAYAALEDSLRIVLGAGLAAAPDDREVIRGRPGVGPAEETIRRPPGTPGTVRTQPPTRPARPTTRPAPDP
jgi:tetratricopeptide (TPR) repeat protein